MNTYLFDWGDTLMVDDPHQAGAMCDWETVCLVDGAYDTLEYLSQSGHIYIATGAADSNESQIKRAFERVGLSRFITGYFCQENLGVGKDDEAFFNLIIAKLDIAKSSITMVGDSFQRDVQPALTSGINAVWFNPTGLKIELKDKVLSIRHLRELCK